MVTYIHIINSLLGVWPTSMIEFPNPCHYSTRVGVEPNPNVGVLREHNLTPLYNDIATVIWTHYDKF